MRRRSVILALSATLAMMPLALAQALPATGFQVAGVDAAYARVAAGMRCPSYDVLDAGTCLRLPPVLTSSDVRAVRVVGDSQNGLAIEVTLSPRGSRELFNYTSAHLGEEFAFVLDGKVISTPVITVPVRGQTIVIVSEHLGPDDYERIARRIQDLLRAEMS